MQTCKPDYDFTNLVIMAQTVHFLNLDNEYVKPLEGTKYEWIIRYKTFAKLYTKSRKLNENKKHIVKKIDDDPVFQLAKQSENISFLVFILELTRIWIESYPQDKLPAFTVSKKKLRHGARHLTIDMIKLKRADKEQYEDKKLIIDTSKEAAKQVWGAINRHLLCAEHPYKEN